MKNRFLFLFLFFLMIPQVTSSQEFSTEEMIETFRSYGRAGPILIPTIEAYRYLCPQSHDSDIRPLEEICETVVESTLCRKIPKERRLRCENIGEKLQYNPWDFLKGCAKGALDSVEKFLTFVWEFMKWVWDNSTDSEKRSKTWEKAGQYTDIVKLYLYSEFEKAYEKTNSPFRTVKALKKMRSTIALTILKSIVDLIEKKYREFGCLNFESKSRVMCELVGDIFIPPTAALGLLKYGPKAFKMFPMLGKAFGKLDHLLAFKKVRHLMNSKRLAEAGNILNKVLGTKQREAIVKAHNIGKGLKGKDGTLAKLGNYTMAQLKQKAKILKEAGFNQSEVRKLMENGIVGLSEGETKLMGPLLKRTPAGIEINPALLGKERVRLLNEVIPGAGKLISLKRSNGALVNGEVVKTFEDRVLVVFRNSNGDFQQKILYQSDVYDPINIAKGLRVGDEVSLPRSSGGRSNGKIGKIEGDKVTVHFIDERTGKSAHKEVQAKSLTSPLLQEKRQILPKVVIEHGLKPKDSVLVNGVGKVEVGKFFRDKGGRIFTLAKVEVDGKVSYRLFYRSNSQSVFRLMPARNVDLRAPGYDKGVNENMLTAPSDLQAFLSERLKGVSREGMETIDIKKFEGIIPVNKTTEDYRRYLQSEDFVDEDLIKLESLVDESKLRPLESKSGRAYARPQDVTIKDPALRPDYRHPAKTYDIDSPLYGRIKAYVYKSKRGPLEYTLLRDSKGRVWFGDIGFSNSSLTPQGLRSYAVDARELMTPLWEYQNQIPVKYMTGEFHPLKGQYGSTWSYIREMPEIRRWYLENGLEVPGP